MRDYFRWGSGGRYELAKVMLAAGLRAVLTCVAPSNSTAQFIGNNSTPTCLLNFLATVDPCGDAGQFHTFC